MPSDELLMHFQEHVHLEDHWIVDGTHYYKTGNAWLEKLDANKEKVRWPRISSSRFAATAASSCIL
eukprot:9263330-Prorocentrum_lima.AAC.2